MVAYGFFAEIEAKEGKEDEVEAFLKEAKTLVDAEPGTIAWFAFPIGPRKYRIFDAFDSEQGREEHLEGKVKAAIVARAEELFTDFPTVTPVNLLAAKLPN
ncbi:antibiotic biosynthesis monooxygenase [Amycolatopsis sp. NPDC005232]|uniref:putative quinol monooxygenase n=1 Tax=Amycolatopsis sp. NPDC005232 TaxID=3157027 RepID=UPI0033B6947C